MAKSCRYLRRAMSIGQRTSHSNMRRGGPIIVDAADLPESLRAQLQALESARSRKRGEATGGDGAAEAEDDEDDEDDPALVSAATDILSDFPANRSVTRNSTRCERSGPEVLLRGFTKDTIVEHPQHVRPSQLLGKGIR